MVFTRRRAWSIAKPPHSTSRVGRVLERDLAWRWKPRSRGFSKLRGVGGRSSGASTPAAPAPFLTRFFTASTMTRCSLSRSCTCAENPVTGGKECLPWGANHAMHTDFGYNLASLWLARLGRRPRDEHGGFIGRQE